MSMQALQHVVCRGAIDREFMALLARSPREAVRGFGLTVAEEEMIVGLGARTLVDLADGVEAWRRGALHPVMPVGDQRSAALATLAG
jgi:hypothetical protein